MADQPDGQPPAAAEDGMDFYLADSCAACDDESEAAAHHSHCHQTAVGRLAAPAGSVGDGGKKRRKAAPGQGSGGGGTAMNATVAVTLGSLPDDVLAVVFGFCDTRGRMMAIPAVSRRWLGVCRHLMRHPAIDLAWAVRGRSCAITDAGVAGEVRRFPGAATINLSRCEGVTDSGVALFERHFPSAEITT